MKVLKIITLLISICAIVLLAYVLWGNFSEQGRHEFRGESGIALWFFSIVCLCLFGSLTILLLLMAFLIKRKSKLSGIK